MSRLRGGRRRGPAKRAPKDIFSPGAKKEPKKPVVAPTPRNQPIVPPIAITPPKVAGSDKEKKIAKELVKPKPKTSPTEVKEPQEVKKEVEPEKKVEEPSKEIIADQIFGSKAKKTRGLKQITKKEDSKNKDLNIQSDRAAALIEQSRQRAMQPIVEKIIEKKEVKPVVTKRRRNTKTSYQPAARAKRLNRSRHMEYKYEMRKLLDDINVPEEHRSNLLGTIWAKGERKTASDAKDFLVEKMSEGAINEEQKSRLEKVIDDYTIRR